MLALAALAPAQTFTTLHSFPNGLGGGLPYAGLTKIQPAICMGPPTTVASQAGEWFSRWTPPELKACCTPFARRIMRGRFRPGQSVWFGTRLATSMGPPYFGGTNCNNGCGTVFEIDIARNETVLHTFGYSDGCYPSQGLVMDISGALFGTTSGYDCSDNGNIFTVDSAGIFEFLHSFAGPPSDGAYPNYGNLAMDKSGNLYGLTAEGGAHNWGALYELSEKPDVYFYCTALCPARRMVVTRRDPWCATYTETSMGPPMAAVPPVTGLYGRWAERGKETILHNFAGGSERRLLSLWRRSSGYEGRLSKVARVRRQRLRGGCTS